MTAVIVEDEIQSHEVLKSLLSQNHSDVEVAASAFTVEEGFQKVTEHNPDVVFLDVELPDGLGFDLLKRIPEPDFFVIFITAYDTYALTAIHFGALDYLLKPVASEALEIALKKARENLEKKISTERIQILLETLSKLQKKELPSRLIISTQNSDHFFDLKDIIRLEAQQNYTEFTIANRPKKLLASTNIGSFEKQFELHDDLKRVHRSHLVNINYIDKFVKSEGYLLIKNGDKVPISKKYWNDL